MFKVYIDHKKMSDICLEQDEKNKWYQILGAQKEIWINCDTDDDDFNSEDNPLFVFSQMKNIKFHNARDYMDAIPNCANRVLENPCGAFILDIDKDKAQEIQNRFGVICQSVNDMNEKFLTLVDIYKNTETGGSYSKIFPLGNLLPSNSLILVDRYLFASGTGENLDDAYENILDIMDAFMPINFDDEYHVCIIFNMDTVKDCDVKSLLKSDKSEDFTEDERQKAFEKLSTRINKLKNEYVKKHKYNVSIELLSCDNRDKISYDKTHDRYIISNYYFITATWKLKAFREEKALKNQTFTALSLYAKGIGKPVERQSDIPKCNHSRIISDCQSMFLSAKVHPTLYRYSQNGNAKISINDVKNRLIKI